MASGGGGGGGGRSGVVTTVAGDGKVSSRDGFRTGAGLITPYALVKSSDEKHFIFGESSSHRIRRFDLADGWVSTLLGGTEGFKNGDSKSAAFNSLYALCADPLKPNNLYIGDKASIRYWDTATNQVTLIAGDAKIGYADGVSSNARFHNIAGLLCHPNGKTLFVCDQQNNRIRKIDLTSGAVTTIAGDGKKATRDGTGVECSIYASQQIVFDRSPNLKPNSVLIVTSEKAIRRFDIETGVMTTLKLKTSIDPIAVVVTPSGHLIVSCFLTRSLYSIDLTAGEVVRIAGGGKAGFADGVASDAFFTSIYGMAVIEREQCLYSCDFTNHRIRRITLPPHLFHGSAASPPPLTTAGVHSACEARESKLTAELKAMTDRCTALTSQVKSLSDQVQSEQRQRIVLSTQLKAAESLAAASKQQITELQNRLMDRDSKQFLDEVNDRSPNGWSGAAVVYWVEHVFGREHKTAQISEFVTELRSRPGLSGSDLLSLTTIKQFRALKLLDVATIELFQDAIEALKQRPNKSAAEGGSGSSGSGDVVLPP